MAQSTRQPRQTRSSAACDSCRSKKQKCGGEWPTCARCRETGNDCTWPPQLQRGPAKGYLEAIEARLDDVEHILLQVLPLVPAEQLLGSVTCHNDSVASVSESSQKRTTQEKRAALDYWTSFPLNSPQAVLAWCNDRLRRDSARRVRQSGNVSMDPNQNPADGSAGTPRSAQGQLAEATMSDAGRHQPDSGGPMVGNWPIHHLSYAGGAPDPAGNTPDGTPRTPTHHAGPNAAGITQHMQGPPSISSSVQNSRFDLSDEFHAKFLW